MLVGTKRIYDKPDITDGQRILVDRLWPRGVKKSTSNIDVWLKEIAPSDELRKWFSHEADKWEEFKRKYKAELDSNKAFEELLKTVKESDVTFIFASKDAEHNNAVALAEFVRARITA